MSLANSFKGFESIYAAIRMFTQMIVRIVAALLVIQIVIVSSIVYFRHLSLYGPIDRMDVCLIRTYYTGKIALSLSFFQREVTVHYACETGSRVVSYDYFLDLFGSYVQYKIALVRDRTLSLVWWTCLLYLLLPVILAYFSHKHIQDTRDSFLRGAKFVTADSMPDVLKPAVSKEISFKITERISLPLSITSRHTFVIGKPGTGKTQLIGRILDQILKNGFRAIIHDFKGDFISTYYDFKKHYIFNPLDKRHMGLKDREMDLIERMREVRVGELNKEIRKKYSEKFFNCGESKKIVECFSYSELLDTINDCNENLVPESRVRLHGLNQSDQDHSPSGWSIFNELASPVDIDAFCASLIPESASQDNFWPISSRQLLGSIITFCIYHGKTRYDDLWATVNKSNEELLELFKNTPGCEEGMKLLTEAKTANNILAVLSNYTKPIKYLRGTDGDFSIKKWVRDARSEKRVIFLSNYAMIQETIKPFLTLFVDFSTKTLCSLDDDLNRRLFIILDEFGQLSKIGSIIQLLTQSRSKGGASFILIQDVAQIASIYGKEGSTSIVNSCGNTVSFAVSDESTADFISKKIGSMEIKRSEESKSMGVDDLRDSISISRQTTEKRVVMPSEIMNVPTMNCFIQLTDCPVTRDRLEFMKFPKRRESYIGREDLLLSRSPSSGGNYRVGNSEEAADEFFETTKQAVEELMHKPEPEEEYYGVLEPVITDPAKADTTPENNKDQGDFF